ncbi:PLP-dependent transferase [Anoxynatronum buryatiense]|uniref:Cys/Met metabolism PLP-dependent enzyme n=1 Tax=Anoxynatronum buryatiense TaxID=489973 RepID=A0AA45WXG2_9CLOT|nr:PLP-dependent transferase [Anoxynatronum buryatiense]SMP63809.1 Cys/Met metabolism PLP-dependent enzyme [Anoxynatronum buryatiense]
MMRGLKTLHLRMERHCENALAFARAMEKHPKIRKVRYPGLPDDPFHRRAQKYFNDFGGIVGLEIEGDLKKVQELVFQLKLCYFAVSLGDLDTLVQIPALMTHGKVPREEREKMGIMDGVIRVSVGVEHVEDIIGDFEQALEKL